MPGIAGIISQRPAEECESLVRTMISSMNHESFYVSGRCSVPELGIYGGWLAHTDSFAAKQNTSNADSKLALLFAGECFGAERRIVDLYEHQGADCPQQLNGLFAGMLIDKRLRKMFLFNDRYGMERIYWHEADGEFYFASEAKALLRVLPALRQFDAHGVAQFLVFGCTTGVRTLFRGIELLPGGSLWTFEVGRCHKEKYFSPEEWESRPVLSSEAFQSKFEETFKEVLPRYCNSDSRIGISLTGGLDSRMIMACRPEMARQPICYTFSGKTGETFDDRLAARVAQTCGLEHRLLRLGPDFFSDFATHADRTVYTTDGCFGIVGAHEVYLNNKARQLAPVRLTGNFGSEVLRGVSTFQKRDLAGSLIDAEVRDTVDFLRRSVADSHKHPITAAAFHEVPFGLFGSLEAGRSQTIFRTPYLDNEIVSLAYQIPEELRMSPAPAAHLIKNNNSVLANIPGDLGQIGLNGQVNSISTRLFRKATFKLDYINNEGWPNWLSPFDSIFSRVTSSLRIVGLHKYLHYRSWFRRELAGYVHDAITEARNRQAGFWHPAFLEQMVQDHIRGRKNYVSEIDAVLTLEAVERLLFRGFPDKVEDHTGDPAGLRSTTINGHGSDQVNHLEKPKAVSGNSSIELKCLPTFLGIGSMRCGSTWLYEVLKIHPDIRMSDCKEMDFFFMAQMLQHDLRWYEAKFRPGNGAEPKPVRGEISPLYARLKPWQVKRIAELLPDARIIITLRHPVERAWSQALYEFGFRSQRDLRRVRWSEFLRQLERPRSKLSSDYYRTVKVWSDAFGSKALHVSLFDQLRNDPETYVNDILRHIGASTPWRLPRELTQKKVWSTSALVAQEREIPEIVRWYIADQLLEPTERLDELLEGKISTWVEELRDIRGRTRLSWRILKEINRTILSLPEGLAYDAYHAVLDFRLWRHWRRLQTTHLR